ncbi:MAG: aminoacyl-tRNA hydrolase [Epsilonproteobacteria bacterium]|nr:aminoacyl-tRNA hydrolase [Campylobacterota bacterium]
MKLIAGLGNPGSAYRYNRHNIGFLVVDYLKDKLSCQDITKKSFFGELFKCRDILLLKPTTFMNNSGKSISAVKNFYKIDNSDIIVIHDDIDLPFGAIRIKRGGGNGGHNGLKSIDSYISKDYIRIRVGVGKPPKKEMVASYVLSDFNQEEQEVLDRLIKYVANIVEALTKNPLDVVKSKYSKKDGSYLRDV